MTSPLHPALDPQGEQDALALLEKFKAKFASLAEGIVRDLYTDITPHIETDAWTNFRNSILDGLCDYSRNRTLASYDFAKIRNAIFNEHREEIIADLNQDLWNKSEEQAKEIESLRRRLAERSNW